MRAAATVFALCAGVLWSGAALAQSATPTAVVLTSGSSWTPPAGVTSFKVWAVGGGGGGGGSGTGDGFSAGGGGAGGAVYKTFSVSSGTLTYTLGTGGKGGVYTAGGSAGGTTTITYGGMTLTATGGGGGGANNNVGGAGGNGSGGEGAAIGGAGQGVSGDTGGGYGGGIGGAVGSYGGTDGGTGANAADVSSLFDALALAQQPTTSGGAAGTSESGSNNLHGGNATGFGCGGGGAGWYGGNGGSGRYGGGGGGAATVSSASLTGGDGGQGAIVISYLLPPGEPPPPVPPSGPTRVSLFGYDPTSGLLTQEVIEPDTPALRLQTDYTLNAFGQKVSITVSGADIVTRSATTTYDGGGKFPVSATNAAGHAESWEYDPRFGTPTKHTGPNKLDTIWQHDDFGRKTLELRADGTRTTWSYLYCAGTNGGTVNCPAGATHLMQVEELGPDGTTKIAPSTTNYYDQLDRVIAADTEGFDGSLIRTEARYDALGRVEKKSRPYFVAGGTPQWIAYTYDALGRVLTETQPDGGVTTSAYHGLTTSVTNAANQTTTTTKNSRGQVLQVKDADNNVTSYEYEPFGNLAKVTDALGNVRTFGYDIRGRTVAANDPDMGSWTYTYDVLDALKTQTDAAGAVTTVSYDLLGRAIQRVEPGFTSTWTWDTAPKGIGRLASASTNGGYSRSHTYDALGRQDQVQITINGVPYTIATSYDAASRVSKVTYPSSFAVAYSYNATGYQYQLSNAATSEVYWTANARDAELHLSKQTAGNGVVTTQVFDPQTGRLTNIVAGDAGAVQSQAYTYDLVGKLLTRSDANTSLSESFTYDALNRLASSTVTLTPAPLVATFAYNAIGNLTFKSDVGTYSYPAPGEPRPHGVTSISGGAINTTFSYDAKGNMTSGNGLSVTYTSFNKPATITRGTASVSFDHDPEYQRYAQTSLAGITLYFAGGGVLAERFAGSGGTVRWTNYLIVAGQLIGIHIENSDDSTVTRYFHTDHLGSIAVITNEVGAVMERLSYDAWGLRRQPDGTPDPSGSISSQSSRGFTGHEHLAEVGLIHMNGRVYDPLLGRFGTPDPMTEDPFSTQGWNRYSYVGNSPVNFTDPTGYCFLGCFWKPLFKAVGQFFQRFWGTIVQFAATAICVATPGCQPFLPLIAGVTSAVVTGITSGNLGLALKAGFISMVTSFIMQNVAAEVGGGSSVTSTQTTESWAYGYAAETSGPPGASPGASGVPSDVGESGTLGTAAATLPNPPSVPVPSPAPATIPGMSFGQGLLLQGLGIAATTSLGGSWQRPSSRAEIRASDYLQRAVDPCPFGKQRAGGGDIVGTDCFGGGMGGGGGLSQRALPAPRAPLTGQIHHAISVRIQRALEAHPNLRGLYTARDPRFTTQARDRASHWGYDTPQRNLEREIIDWLGRNPNATQQQFESYLRGVYQRPDVLRLFPNGLP
jgi:RHS repeat-associated protein